MNRLTPEEWPKVVNVLFRAMIVCVINTLSNVSFAACSCSDGVGSKRGGITKNLPLVCSFSSCFLYIERTRFKWTIHFEESDPSFDRDAFSGNKREMLIMTVFRAAAEELRTELRTRFRRRRIFGQKTSSDESELWVKNGTKNRIEYNAI